MKRTQRFKHLALAVGLAFGVAAGGAQAQATIDVGGASTIGDSTLTVNSGTALVPTNGDKWSADGGTGTVFSDLISPASTVPTTGTVTLTFNHRFNFEGDGWDGGAIYVSVNGGTATYVDTSAITGQNYTLDGHPSSSAWADTQWIFTGASPGFGTPADTTTVVNLGTLNAGDTVSVIFRGGWDAAFIQTPAPNWEVSTVKLTDSIATDFLDVDFNADGPSGFTVVDTGTAGPWVYLKPTNKFEINGDTLAADRYAPSVAGSVIDLNDANIQISLLSGTLNAGDTFSLFDLSGGTTLTGSIGTLTLPGVPATWSTTMLAVDGTISVLGIPTPASQLGVLDLAANGGLNPNTGAPWAIGDQYRIAFHTLNTTDALSNDPNDYNDFATAEAWAVTALQGTHWKAMVTVNLVDYLTEDASPDSTVRVATGTDDQSGGAGQGGAGDPVYVVDGTTCIARNNADIWNAWSNPFAANAVVRTGSVHYSPYLNQFGNQTVNPDANHGKDIWTGCNVNGNEINALGVSSDVTSATRGNSNANNTGRVWQRFTDGKTAQRSLYAISAPLTIVDASETTAPSLVSIDDDQGATVAKLGVDSIAYTVTFDEAMDAATITTADFATTGSASATIDIVRGTLDPAVFEVTVTPTSAGTFLFLVNAGASVADPVGNVLTFGSEVVDDQTITVIQDVTPPTLASSDIVDNVSGGPVIDPATVVYSVTFSEPILASSIGTDDFENGGTINTTVTDVSQTAEDSFNVTVVTSDVLGASTLILQVKAGAIITDLSSNDLDTTSAIPDDTTIAVDNLPSVDSITANVGAGPVFADQTFWYSVVFSEAMDSGTVGTADFEDGSTSGASIDSVVASSDPAIYYVEVTPGGAGTIILQVASGASLTDTLGNALDTTSAIPDDAPVFVNAGSTPAREAVVFGGLVTTAFNATGNPVTANVDVSSYDKLVAVVTGEHGFNNTAGNCASVTLLPFGGGSVAFTQAVDRAPVESGVDTTYNDIWYLDDPGSFATSGTLTAACTTRGNLTIIGLNNTADGYAATAISPRLSKSVDILTVHPGSVVITSLGMGGDGNTANTEAVNTVSPLTEISAVKEGSNWDGHVTGWASTADIGPSTYTYVGGNSGGVHTIAAEFFGSIVVVVDTPYSLWAATNGLTEGVNDGQGDDADSGSLNNLGEFGLGGDPLNANDDGSLLHAFSDDVAGGAEKEGILTILVRSGASFTDGAPAVSAAVDGIVYTVSADSTLPVGGSVTVTGTTPVTTGLPAAPAGYEYASFYISGAEGYFQVTVAPE